MDHKNEELKSCIMHFILYPPLKEEESDGWTAYIKWTVANSLK